MRSLPLFLALVACRDEPAVPAVDAAAQVDAAPATPDILLVYVDTLRADHLGTYGYARPTSPRIDDWATRGSVFTRAYSQSGWTLASTASLFAGQYPHQHRVVRDSKQPDRFGCLVPATETLPEQLGLRGYATAAFINNTFMAPEFGLQQGFDLYDYQGATNTTHRSAVQTVDAALDWWDAHADRPRFAVVHMMEPHLNYAAPDGIRGTFAKGAAPPRLKLEPGKADPFVAMQFNELAPTDAEKQWTVDLYDEEVLAVDTAMGRLLDGLAARDAMDSTLVILTSDHGEEFWEHERFEHGHALWSPLTHVPLIVVGPGADATRIETVVEHVDLFQGLLARAGASRPPDSAGEDLFHVARNPTGRTALMENCLYGEPCISLVDDSHRVMLNPLRGYAGVHPILGGMRDGPQVQGPEQNALGQPLLDAVRAKRGSLLPVLAVGGGPRVPSYETFEMLSELGYVDRPDQPKGDGPVADAAATPCGG
ncbi:MAG: sulfatase [Myxococcota bacterium]|nr:sulfatase [Myxococcota bacterium]MEC8424907.1 sulfatase [Myxococcota bacterium]